MSSGKARPRVNAWLDAIKRVSQVHPDRHRKSFLSVYVQLSIWNTIVVAKNLSHTLTLTRIKPPHSPNYKKIFHASQHSCCHCAF